MNGRFISEVFIENKEFKIFQDNANLDNQHPVNIKFARIEVEFDFSSLDPKVTGYTMMYFHLLP